jgi:hypothetical protein
MKCNVMFLKMNRACRVVFVGLWNESVRHEHSKCLKNHTLPKVKQTCRQKPLSICVKMRHPQHVGKNTFGSNSVVKGSIVVTDIQISNSQEIMKSKWNVHKVEK